MKKLLKRFYIGFVIGLLVMAFVVSLFMVISISVWIQYSKTEGSILSPILASGLLLFFIVISIRILIPYIKDYVDIKKEIFHEVTGIVIKYRKVVSGGEPPTTNYYPIIRDDAMGNMVELIVSDTKLNQRYTFYYLRFTKLAEIKKTTIC
jgi:hypothetical protein